MTAIDALALLAMFALGFASGALALAGFLVWFREGLTPEDHNRERPR